jgi:Protein of unknown function (DUF3551)
MRFAASSLLLILSVAGVTTMATPAAAQSKYCLQGTSWGYPGNCQFSSYAQCRATASGTNASCGINPRYAYGRQRGYQRYRGY